MTPGACGASSSVARRPDEPVVVLAHRFAGGSDYALHECAAFATFLRCPGWRVEDDDVAPRRRAEVETDAARNHAVHRVAETAGILGAPRAVQRRLHRGARDPIRVESDEGQDYSQGKHHCEADQEPAKNCAPLL